MWEWVELCVTRWSLRFRVSPAATTRWAAQALMKRAERPPRLSEIKKKPCRRPAGEAQNEME